MPFSYTAAPEAAGVGQREGSLSVPAGPEKDPAIGCKISTTKYSLSTAVRGNATSILTLADHYIMTRKSYTLSESTKKRRLIFTLRVVYFCVLAA